jgi:hypothetical protein
LHPHCATPPATVHAFLLAVVQGLGVHGPMAGAHTEYVDAAPAPFASGTHDCPAFGHVCVGSQKRMHTGDGAVLEGFTHVRPGPQSVPAKFGRSEQASPSIFVPMATHAAKSRPAESSANEAQPLPPLHVDGSKTLQAGVHP